MINFNNEKGQINGCLSTKFNCNAYIINKCKGGRKKSSKVLQAIFHNSSMAETISGLKSKSYTLECDHSVYKTLRYCRFFKLAHVHVKAQLSASG